MDSGNSTASPARILWKGDIFPCVSLILFLSANSPRSVLYELRCDLVAGQPTQTLSGELLSLTGVDISTDVDKILPLIRGLYFDWVKQEYKEEMSNERRQ